MEKKNSRRPPRSDFSDVVNIRAHLSVPRDQIQSDVTVQPSVTISNNHSEVFAVAWSPDGSHLAAGTGDGSISVFHAETGRASYELQKGQRAHLVLYLTNTQQDQRQRYQPRPSSSARILLFIRQEMSLFPPTPWVPFNTGT